MACSVKVIADSVHGLTGKRLITFQLRYWRAIHSELMTHRVFSRNASSSRAIPVAKMIEQVLNDCAGPIRFMKNQPGMQSVEPCSPVEEAQARRVWLDAAHHAVASAQKLIDLNVHKQFANRLLEPFQYISVIVTATEWDNWFELRDHEDAQPEIRELAMFMRQALAKSEPKTLRIGEWHLPYVKYEELKALTSTPIHDEVVDVLPLAKLSVARCARVSYLTHDGKEPSQDADLKLYDRLMGGKPWHASPTEHQALVGDRNSDDMYHSNLSGCWIQFRKILEKEHQYAFA